MKKTITILILSLFIEKSMAQTNLSMSYSHRAHFQLELAHVDQGTGLLFAAGIASNKDMNPFMLFIKGGYEQLLGNEFTLTGAAGVAKHNFYSSFKSENYSKAHPILSLEFAKDWNNGRLFIGANNTGQEFYINLGIKVKFQ